MATYVGKRIIPIHCGEWDSTVEYENLSIVLHTESGNSYTSRKTVPPGTAITNTDYWAKSANGIAESTLEELQNAVEELAGREDITATELKTTAGQCLKVAVVSQSDYYELYDNGNLDSNTLYLIAEADT